MSTQRFTISIDAGDTLFEKSAQGCLKINHEKIQSVCDRRQRLKERHPNLSLQLWTAKSKDEFRMQDGHTNMNWRSRAPQRGPQVEDVFDKVLYQPHCRRIAYPKSKFKEIFVKENSDVAHLLVESKKYRAITNPPYSSIHTAV